VAVLTAAGERPIDHPRCLARYRFRLVTLPATSLLVTPLEFEGSIAIVVKATSRREALIPMTGIAAAGILPGCKLGPMRILRLMTPDTVHRRFKP
jgi:hypothetical protein